MRLSSWTLILVLFLTASTEPAGAKGFDDDDLSLRLPAAFSRFSSYGDVAASGGASAGSKWLSSINPASAAWRSIESRYHVSLSPQYSAIVFREGTRMHITTESITWETKDYGTFQPAFAQVRSNEASTRQDLELDFELDYAQLQWAKRFGDRFALGANVNVASSELRFDLEAADISETTADSYGLRVGSLYRIRDHLLAGLVFDYVHSPSTMTLSAFATGGLGAIQIDDRTDQFILRPGISYEYKKDSSLYLDYQFGSFSNDTGQLDVHRFLAGIDHRLSEWLFLRGGFVLDTEINDSWTCGLGIYPSDWFTIDIAYQYDMFPELEPELGRSQVVTVSFGFQF